MFPINSSEIIAKKVEFKNLEHQLPNACLPSMGYDGPFLYITGGAKVLELDNSDSVSAILWRFDCRSFELRMLGEFSFGVANGKINFGFLGGKKCLILSGGLCGGVDMRDFFLYFIEEEKFEKIESSSIKNNELLMKVITTPGIELGVVNKNFLRMIGYFSSSVEVLMNSGIFLEVDLENKEVTKSSIIPLLEGYRFVTKGCIVGDYFYVFCSANKNEVIGNDYTDPHVLVRIKLENPTKWEFVSEKRFNNVVFIQLFQYDERYLMLTGGCHQDTTPLKISDDYKKTLISILSLKTMKWRDVEIHSIGFNVCRSGSAFCFADGILYGYGGIIGKESLEAEILNELYSIDLFKNEIHELDENGRIEFLLDLFEEDCEEMEMFRLCLKLSDLSFKIPILFLL